MALLESEKITAGPGGCCRSVCSTSVIATTSAVVECTKLALVRPWPDTVCRTGYDGDLDESDDSSPRYFVSEEEYFSFSDNDQHAFYFPAIIT